MDTVATVDRPGETVTDANGAVSTSLARIYPTPDDLATGNPGRCKVQQTISQASNPTAGGHLFTIQDARVDFPVLSGPFQPGDLINIVGSESNPHLEGNAYTVAEEYEKSYPTAQRVRVKQVTA